MRKVLVAFDGSEPAKRALQYAIDLARDSVRPVQIHVLNAQYGAVVYGDYLTESMVQDINNGLLAEAEKVLEQAAGLLAAADIPYQTHAALGIVPEQVNLAIKQLGCDTVIMGTRGLGSFGGLMLGSVANRVVHEVSVPVVLVK
ncbi:MAG TPA: universal stress protein [Pseudomonas sp.]|jgi:nucleotide-binding universal stress UspA family protein